MEDFFSPVQEFFASLFSSEPVGVADEVPEENFKDTKLELVADEYTLSPGDPTNVLWEVPETPLEPPLDPYSYSCRARLCCAGIVECRR